jgi:hypothetical protein
MKLLNKGCKYFIWDEKLSACVNLRLIIHPLFDDPGQEVA